MGEKQRAEIVMTDDEATSFVAASRTATLATIGPNGVPHLTAMWFGIVDGAVCFETKAKSQKALNLRRDPTVACMIEAGETYDQLRGVAIEGSARVIDDTDDPVYWAAARSLFERYYGPVDAAASLHVERMMHKRVVVRIESVRIRSWDHRKLDLPPMPRAGTTAS
jgi:PPOX class probable F420-dependent enzyme